MESCKAEVYPTSSPFLLPFRMAYVMFLYFYGFEACCQFHQTYTIYSTYTHGSCEAHSVLVPFGCLFKVILFIYLLDRPVAGIYLEILK